MRIALVALTLAVILGASAACGGGGGSDTGDFSNSVSRERDGVSLAIATDRANYGEGQDVFFRATLSNRTGAAISYGNAADITQARGVTISINTVLAGEQAMPPTDDSEDDPNGGTLEQSGSVSTEAEWDRVLPTYTTPVDAPAGVYTATARAVVLLEGASVPIELTAAVDFTLDTGDAVALPETVIQAAVAQQEVKDWFEGRQTNVICAYGGRLIFYNVDVITGAIAETFQQLYDVALQQGDPICSPVTEGDMWRVIFTDIEGEPPVKVSALLDLRTADFIRLEEGGPTPAPATIAPAQ